MKQFFDIIISINVHEKPDYLYTQLKNIEEHIDTTYLVILNCNAYMFDILKNKKLKNIKLNPNFTEKKRYHGSLINGVYSNMVYALNMYKFQYFITLSSRNFFCNRIESVSVFDNYKMKISKAWWNNHRFKYMQTKLYKHLLEKMEKIIIATSPHEGMTFNYNTCIAIKKIFENNSTIADDLFNYNACVEEFALQTLVANLGHVLYFIGVLQVKTLDYIPDSNANFLVYKKDR